MGRVVKLLISIFVGVDVLVACYFGLANLRVALFGMGQIPGGGSALDMAIFLIPLFIGYVAGDRMFYFLTYKERREARLRKLQAEKSAKKTTPQAGKATSIWEDRGWDDSLTNESEARVNR